jgi:predicted permease
MFRQTRQVIRGLFKARGFTAASVLTLALASGATAAILAVVHGILAAPLPFRQPDRLVAVWPRQFQSNADLIYQREHARMFAGLAAVAPGWNMSLHDVGEPAKVTVARTSGNLFDVLGTAAALGRTFSDADGNPGSPPVAVLSHGLWRQRFGGDPAAIGRAVRLDDLRVTIIGVMPPSFEVLGLKTDIYTPLTLDSSAWYHAMAFSLYLGRLNDGFSLNGASRDYRAMLDDLRRERGYPGDYGRTARLQDLRESITGNARQALLILGATAVVIMLIAAVNVGTLFLTRTAGRRHALAIRTALGASRTRIAGELLLESAAIAVAGAALGVLLAAVLLPVLLAMLPPDTPRLAEIRFDVRVMMVVLAGAAGLSVLFGAVPVAAARQLESSGLLRSAFHSESIGSKQARAVMVCAEIALAVVLLTSAGLMIRTLTRLARVAPGFAADGVLRSEEPRGGKE